MVVAACIAGVLEYVARSRNYSGYVRSTSPREVYELRPGQGDRNEFGQRDRAYSRAKPPATFRVAGIGDSFTYGMGVPRERVFLKQAEELLGRSANRPIEVINFGVPGYNTAQEANQLEDVVAGWDPDLVVLQFCANDFELPNFIQTSGGPLVTRSFALHVVLAKLAKGWPDFVKRELMGYRYGLDVFPVPGLEHAPKDGPDSVYEVAGKTYTAKGFTDDPAKVPPEYRYMVGVEGVQAALRRIAAWSRANRVPVIFLVIWSGKTLDGAKLGAAEGFDVVDVWPAITRYLDETGQQFTDLWVAPPNDSHPNEKGHAVIGQVLAEAIAPYLAAAGK